LAVTVFQHVFISYRQESLDHSRAVRRLGELLRQSLKLRVSRREEKLPA
jgi:hypothetical protein